MISIKEALARVKENTAKLDSVKVDLLNALGSVLSESIQSPINMPPFDQSAMDGYALGGDAAVYTVVSEIQAGASVTGKLLSRGEAARIFTGAMIPEGTTSIAKQEIVKRQGDTITLVEEVREGMSIRKKGEELAINELAISQGTYLNPAAIGFLSGLGIQKVNVYRKPKIAVIVTGNELTKPGEKLLPGRIYESNSATLTSVLKHAGFDSSLVTVKDDFNSTKETIGNAIDQNDVVIITGGISVGDYDFVGKALAELRVEEVFYKVKQKPGKPLFYGKKGAKSIFALPGNPAAVLTCYYMYVGTAIRSLIGISNPMLEEREVSLLHDFTKKGDRAHLLKAYINTEGVKVHTGQSSAMLSSFVGANCLIYLSEEDREIKKGDKVLVYILPI
jgi:molybdopterin molybdotransferase